MKEAVRIVAEYRHVSQQTLVPDTENTPDLRRGNARRPQVMSGDFVQRGGPLTINSPARSCGARRRVARDQLPLPRIFPLPGSFARGGVLLAQRALSTHSLRQRERRSLRARKDGGGARHAGICRSAEARTHRRNAVCAAAARTGGVLFFLARARRCSIRRTISGREYTRGGAKLGLHLIIFCPARLGPTARGV